MAVLKSPRNSRNKKKWAEAYAISKSSLHYGYEAKKNPRAVHKLQYFLDTTLRRIVSSQELLDEYHDVEIREYRALLTRPDYPRTHIRLGPSSFKISKSYPSLFHRESRHKKVRKNLTRLLNSNAIIRT